MLSTQPDSLDQRKDSRDSFSGCFVRIYKARQLPVSAVVPVQPSPLEGRKETFQDRLNVIDRRIVIDGWLRLFHQVGALHFLLSEI